MALRIARKSQQEVAEIQKLQAAATKLLLQDHRGQNLRRLTKTVQVAVEIMFFVIRTAARQASAVVAARREAAAARQEAAAVVAARQEAVARREADNTFR